MNQAKICFYSVSFVPVEFYSWNVGTNVERKCRVEVEGRSSVGFLDLESAWDEDNRKADPKATIR